MIRFLALLLFLVPFSLQAQTIVSGKITDAQTGEPLPFVNVAFKGVTVGTTTDIDGNYYLNTDQATDSIMVSFIGYQTMVKKVVKNRKQVINFALKVEQISLPEIVVKPTDENPAHPILKSIIRNKEKNNRENLSAYQYEVYNKVEFDLNNITDEFKNKKLFKPFKFVFDNIDSTSDTKAFLPLFLIESLSDFYFRRSPKAQKEVIKATKVSGIQNESVSQFLGDMYQNTNLYDNYILIFGKSFVSPIADFGLRYYRYYLVDSANFDGTWQYKLKFIPRRKQELTFEGDFWVHDSTFAITFIDMDIVDDANINFVNTLNIKQNFSQVNDSLWLLQKDRLSVDFALTDGTMGFYGKKATSYKDFVINKPKPDDFYSFTENIVVADDANEKEHDFWLKNRHDSLTQSEKTIYHMVDTIKTLPAYRTVADIITLFVTGHKSVGFFDIGPYYKLYSFNQVEGNRFRIGGKTNSKFSKRLLINAYTAYGLKDERIKYGGGFQYLATKKPRQIISASYKYDMEQLGQSENAFSEDNIIASVFRRNPFNKLTFIEEYRASFEREWFPGLSNRVGVRRRVIEPVGTFLTQTANSDSGFNSSITTSEMNFYTRIALKEKFVSTDDINRVSLGTKYPIIQMQYTIGRKGWLGGDYDYHKFNFNWNHWFRLNPMGYTEYMVDAGMILGELPYPILELHRGNETYTSDAYAFNMMNYYEFVSDKYLSLSLTHHFNGFILDRIPLFRKLKWRGIVSGKGVIGGLSDEHASIIAFPRTLTSLDEPYLEGGIGVENIFKIIRVDLLRRFTYLDRPNISKLGVRVALAVNF